MDFTKLKAKLLEPDILALADDQARYDNLIVNTEDIAISTRDIKSYLRINQLWLPLKNSTANSAIIAFDALEDVETTEFDISDAATKSFFESMLTALVNDVTEITTTHRDSILALGENMTSWAEQNGYNPLRIGYLAKARAL